MKAQLIAAVMVLLMGMVSSSSAGTEKTMMGCRGVYERIGDVTRVYCVGDCNRICAIVREGVVGGPYPDELQLFDNSIPTFQSPCLLVGTNPDGTEAYVMLP